MDAVDQKTLVNLVKSEKYIQAVNLLTTYLIGSKYSATVHQLYMTLILKTNLEPLQLAQSTPAIALLYALYYSSKLDAEAISLIISNYKWDDLLIRQRITRLLVETLVKKGMKEQANGIIEECVEVEERERLKSLLESIISKDTAEMTKEEIARPEDVTEESEQDQGITEFGQHEREEYQQLEHEESDLTSEDIVRNQAIFKVYFY